MDGHLSSKEPAVGSMGPVPQVTAHSRDPPVPIRRRSSSSRTEKTGGHHSIQC
jgi:hypothetical protein